jgi:alanine dehydrogenase
MLIGIPRETRRHEHRVGLTPSAVERLVGHGHRVFVEHEAGAAARFGDRDYQRAGGEIAWSPEEVYRRSDLVCRVGALSAPEIELLKPGLVVAAFHHLALAPREVLERLAALAVTLIAYELIRDGNGGLPVLSSMSEIAGPLAVHLGAYYLQNEAGGRGILLGNVPGVPPPTVLILGAGTVGRTAARQALDAGAHVIVVDSDLGKLREIDRALAGRAVTSLAHGERLARFSAIADLLIGAVLVPGSRAPYLVTEAMVRAMKPGSVILDVSIDQGGCVETSRPTTLDDPTFVAHGVVHYCVPNMTANVARTASRSLANAVLPHLLELADRGLEEALATRPGLAQGVCLYRGRPVQRQVGEALAVESVPLAQVLGGKGRP